MIDGQYAYLITDEFPYIPRCMMGEVAAGAGGPGGGAAPTGAAPGDAPDFTDAAAALGVTVDELMAALPPPGEPLDDAAAALGVTVEELMAALPAPPG